MPNNSSAFALNQEDASCKPPVTKCIVPPGAKPLCYANAGTTPLTVNSDQFCGYIQNGFLYSAKGCCTPACPNKNCPDVAPTPPTGVLPFNVERSPELVTEQETVQEVQTTNGMLPFPKLVKLMLVLLCMLVVSALLLSI